MMLAVAGWSLAAALIWSLFDARPLADEPGLTYIEAWPAAAAAGVIVAAVMFPLGMAVGWLWHRSRWGEKLRDLITDHPAESGALLLAAVLGWIVLSYVTFGSLALYRDTFGSELVHKLALSITVPATAAAAGAVAYFGYRPIRNALARIETGWVILTVAGVIAVGLISGWVFGLIELGKVIWQAMTPWIYVPVPAMALGSIVGALLAVYRRLTQLAFAAGLITVASAAFYLIDDTSQQLDLALVYRQTGAGFISGLANPGEAHQFAAAEFNKGQTAVCGPDIEPPRLGDVGHADADAPDIIWLTIDAIRWDHTTMGGHERDTTPNMAEHADDAVIFERANTPSSSTRQTMRALFTGVYPSMIDPPVASIYAFALDDTQITLAEFMRHAGFRTIAYSADGYIFSQDHGAMQGFSHVDEEPFILKDTVGYSIGYTVDNIIADLEDGDGPNFIYSHVMEPHAPYLTGPDPVDFGDRGIDEYDAAIHYTDAELKRLLEFVEQRQQEHPTYLVITADHGEAFEGDGHGRHGYTVRQEETHVPLMIWGPDVAADRHDDPVNVIDIHPTLFELAGLDVPRGPCGESLAGVIRSEADLKPRPVFLEQIPDRSRTHFSVAFIRGDDKLLIHPMVNAVSLYDLSEDPDETNDIASDHPERVSEHLDALRAYLTERGMNPDDYRLDELQ